MATRQNSKCTCRLVDVVTVAETAGTSRNSLSAIGASIIAAFRFTFAAIRRGGTSCAVDTAVTADSERRLVAKDPFLNARRETTTGSRSWLKAAFVERARKFSTRIVSAARDGASTTWSSGCGSGGGATI